MSVLLATANQKVYQRISNNPAQATLSISLLVGKRPFRNHFGMRVTLVGTSHRAAYRGSKKTRMLMDVLGFESQHLPFQSPDWIHKHNHKHNHKHTTTTIYLFICVCGILRGRWSQVSTFVCQLKTLATPHRELPLTLN